MKAKELNNAKGYYASAEGGLAYPVAPNTTFSAAYKVQVIDLGINGQRARDTTNGIILGLSYTF